MNLHHPGLTESAPAPCDKDIELTSSVFRVAAIGSQDNGICTNADIDTYAQDDSLYVVQAGGQEAAFTITRVAPDGNATLVSQESWQQADTYTPDVKAFKQGPSRYIALSLERLSLAAACGVVIVDITDPANITTASIVDQVFGADWCDVHNSFVETDADGDGAFLYATADNTADLRALDIRDLTSITELGKYRRSVRGFFGPGTFDDIYVHDVTVIGGKVYASYWRGGLDIFEASLIQLPGASVSETNAGVLNITPPLFGSTPFLVHHAYPSSGGSRVFIQDEITFSAGFQPVQMWTTSASPSQVDGIELVGSGPADVPFVLPAHNILVDGDRLYVGWYKAGLQAFDFATSGFMGRPMYHQVQTESADDSYDGAWGIRLGTAGGNTLIFQSDRRYGLIVDAPDADDDLVADINDNCPTVANADQDDADSDGAGDACDSGDSDGDLLADNSEYFCGSPAGDPAGVPERVDGSFAGIDDDGDTLVDEALPAGRDDYDCDGDGYTGSAEDHVYSYVAQTDGDQKTCQEYDLSHSNPNPDTKPSLRWPSDFRKGGIPGSTNRINILDLASFAVPVRYLGTNVGTNPGDVRWDLSPGPGALGADINIIDLSLLVAPFSSTGSPPMLDGERAFNGPECPWPP